MKTLIILSVWGFSLLITVTASAEKIEPQGEGISLQNVVVAAVPGMTVVGEVRTVDEVASPRLWGKGRPKTNRYGTSGIESGLCVAGTIDYGLSFNSVEWASAANACPAGTWVCSVDDLKSGGMPYSACDTARPEAAADEIACDGTPSNVQATHHRGWLADSHENWTFAGLSLSEATSISTVAGSLSCESRPVWCCSELLP